MVDVRRKLFEKIKTNFNKKEFDIITGARQTGKSFLLKQLYDDLISSGKQVYFVTLENPDILEAINQHPERIFDYVPKPGDQRIYLLIDEIQYASNPSNFLKLLFDLYENKLKVIATGSSAFYIDRKFNDSLAGRKRLHELYTLDFEEFVIFKRADKSIIDEIRLIRENPKYISLKRPEINTLFDEFLVFGGYPAVSLANSVEEKKEILRELLNTYIKRDIYESEIQYETKFYNLLTVLSHQAGNLMNVNELARTLQLSVSAIENYLYILQKYYHISLLRPFYRNIRKELTKMPKVYFNDLGFRNILQNYFEPPQNRIDKGQVIENYLFIRLRQLYGEDTLNYWRTVDGKEVDFLITTQYNKGFAIELKFNETEFLLSKYVKFKTAYPDYPLKVVSYASVNQENNILKI
jgi:predicted AAA+ superfamily ATPase